MKIYLSNDYPGSSAVQMALEQLSIKLNLKILSADYFSIETPVFAQIIDGIKHSDVVVADISSENPNIYYEIGIAHAIGKPVVLLTQFNQLNRFSLLYNRYYTYDDNSPGNKRLPFLLEQILSSPKEINKLRPSTFSKNILDYPESPKLSRLDYILNLTGQVKYIELEKWISSLLREVPGFEVLDNVMRRGKEYDFVIWNSNEADELRGLGNPLPIEVKASHRIENNFIHSLTSKATSQGFKSFILITTARLSENNKLLIRRLREDSGIAILIVDTDDLSNVSSSKDLVRALITAFRRFFIY